MMYLILYCKIQPLYEYNNQFTTTNYKQVNTLSSKKIGLLNLAWLGMI